MTGAEFRAARQALRLSQRKLAVALDVTKMTVFTWEHGREPIRRVVEYAVRYLAHQRGVDITGPQASG